MVEFVQLVVTVLLCLLPTQAQLSKDLLDIVIDDSQPSNSRLLHVFRLILNNNMNLTSSNAERLNISERVTRNGYYAEEHRVVTEDGYLLLLNRVCKNRGGFPVVVMHGLLQSADTWIEAGPEAGLAYFLADLGYDVWLGNARGSTNSRGHIVFSTSERRYWEFSRDEIGRYDLPAIFDKVLDKTGVSQLSYIGFSQGGGTFFMMCNVRPEYCGKAKIMIGLAPSTRHTNTISPFFRPLTILLKVYEEIFSNYSIHEVLFKGGVFQTALNNFCPNSTLATAFCLEFIYFIDGRHDGSIPKVTTNNVVANFPAGTSVRNLAAYGQAMLSKKYKRYDYGSRNLEVYGVPDPPKYNLRAVTAPVVVLTGKNDGIVDIKDVRWAVNQLPNLLEYHEVENDLWTHLDMTYSKLAPIYIFPKIRHYLSTYN